MGVGAALAEPPLIRPYGSDRLEVDPTGRRHLLCVFSKGWGGRIQKTLTTSEHPGTAVRWGGEVFEVLQAEALREGGVRYTLAPWEERHAIRVIEAYDEASEQARSQVRVNREAGIWKRRLSILFSPLLGHLPGWLQERMESEFGAPAVAMTVVSALPLLVLGVLGYLFHLAASFGGSLLPGGANPSDGGHALPWTPPLPISLYLLSESGLRMGAAFLQGRPLGSLLGVLGYEIWRALRGLPATTAHSFGAVAPSPERVARDRYRMLEPLLALLSTEEQELLERRFGLDVLRWGGITAIVLFIISASNILVSVAMLSHGTADFWDFLWLLLGAYFFVEQLRRRKQLKAGRPAGSALGALVRPLARKLLRRD